MRTVESIINKVLDAEGGKFTDDPLDSGGATKWGWTHTALREMGWFGKVEDLDRDTAFQLYYRRFLLNSRFESIIPIDYDVAYELVDTAVNMGERVAGKFLQVSLNALNNQEKIYPDIAEDGIVGRRTLKALQSYLKYRGAEGALVLLRCLNALQAARYIELAVKAKKNERFVYGWVLNRVVI